VPLTTTESSTRVLLVGVVMVAAGIPSIASG